MMSAVLTPETPEVTSPLDPAELPTQRTLDRLHRPGGFHQRVVMRRDPSPADVVRLLTEAAASRQVVPSSARDGADRLLARLSLLPWRVQRVAQVRASAAYVIQVVAPGLRASLRIGCLPVAHLVQVSLTG